MNTRLVVFAHLDLKKGGGCLTDESEASPFISCNQSSEVATGWNGRSENVFAVCVEPFCFVFSVSRPPSRSCDPLDRCKYILVVVVVAAASAPPTGQVDLLLM